VRSRPGVELTLIGVRRPDQLQANLAALDLVLTDAQMAQLNEVLKPVLNLPADFNNHVAPMFGIMAQTPQARRRVQKPQGPRCQMRCREASASKG
jgi:aldo/keto reductase family protein